MRADDNMGRRPACTFKKSSARSWQIAPDLKRAGGRQNAGGVKMVATFIKRPREALGGIFGPKRALSRSRRFIIHFIFAPQFF
jgi:hypothetical protein